MSENRKGELPSLLETLDVNNASLSDVRRLYALTKSGHPEAPFLLCLIYLSGNAVPRDDERAMSLLRISAERGHAPAQCNLGEIYLRGDLLPYNEPEAVKWLEKAAAQDYRHACLRLAFLRQTAIPRPPRIPFSHPAEAAIHFENWLRESPYADRELDDAEKLYLLGAMIINEDMPDTAMELGIQLLVTAADMDCEKAQHLLSSIEKELDGEASEEDYLLDDSLCIEV